MFSNEKYSVTKRQAITTFLTLPFLLWSVKKSILDLPLDKRQKFKSNEVDNLAEGAKYIVNIKLLGEKINLLKSKLPPEKPDLKQIFSGLRIAEVGGSCRRLFTPLWRCLGEMTLDLPTDTNIILFKFIDNSMLSSTAFLLDAKQFNDEFEYLTSKENVKDFETYLIHMYMAFTEHKNNPNKPKINDDDIIPV